MDTIPPLVLLAAIALLIQWVAFVPAYLRQTEMFFDLTGSLTFITVTIVALVLAPIVDSRSILLLALVVIWAIRLGSFLFLRILRVGRDSRFDWLKKSPGRFLAVWTAQGLWVTFTLAPALVAITTSNRRGLGWPAAAGVLVWIVGFTIEAFADAQKSRFRSDPQNKEKFISSGLWARARHPNYFGEIVLWIGVALVAVPVLRGWQWITLLSPAFVTVLLTQVSGVPALEESADGKWGGTEEYEQYKKNTPLLIPSLLPRR